MTVFLIGTVIIGMVLAMCLAVMKNKPLGTYAVWVFVVGVIIGVIADIGERIDRKMKRRGR